MDLLWRPIDPVRELRVRDDRSDQRSAGIDATLLGRYAAGRDRRGKHRNDLHNNSRDA